MSSGTRTVFSLNARCRLQKKWKDISTGVPISSAPIRNCNNTIRICVPVREISAPVGSCFALSTTGSEGRLNRHSPTGCGRCLEVFVREYSVSPQDIGSVASNISVRSPDGRGVKGGCIVIYDETYGSLRLTERLYLNFEHILDRLVNGVSSGSGDDDDGLRTVVTRLQGEISKFTIGDAAQEVTGVTPTGYESVFRRGSRVCHRQAGQIAVEVEIIQPTMMDGELMYQVAISQKFGQQPTKKWIPASFIEPSAVSDDWDLRMVES